MSFIPRPPQQQAINRTIEEFDSGRRAVLVVQATGTGKTVVAAHVADHFLSTGRILVLAHRDKLIRQAAKKFRQVTGEIPDFEKGIERAAENTLSGKARIVISSFQTQNSGPDGRKRMDRFNPLDFSLLFCDEAHHLLAPSYRAVVDYYMKGNPDLKLLGVTATPDRADGEGLGQIFESVAYCYDLPDAIHDGYLVPIRQRRVIIDGLDFSKVRTTAGDLNAGDLEAAMLIEKPLHGVVHATIEMACGLEQHSLNNIKDEPDRAGILARMLAGRRRRKTLIFTASCIHAERMAEIINRWIPQSAVHIDHHLSPDQLNDAMDGFSTGRFQYLVNVMIASEGYDEPGIELVAMARPTKSRPLYAQMVGRATRPLESLASQLGLLPMPHERRDAINTSDKPHCEILDFVGNAGRHCLVTTADLLGGAEIEDAVIERAKELCLDDCIDVEEALKQAAVDVAAEQEKTLRQAQEEFELAAAEAERIRLADAAKRACVVGTTNYHISDVDALGRYHTTAPREAVAAPKHRDPPSDKQVDFLVKLGVRKETAAGYSKAQASAVISNLKSKRCTTGQENMLRHFGYSPQEIDGMNFSQASAAIETAKGGKVGAA